MLPPILRHILRCLVCSEFNFCQRRDHTLVKSGFENTLENNFFNKLFCSKHFFSFRIDIWAFFYSNLFLKSIFYFGSSQTENAAIKPIGSFEVICKFSSLIWRINTNLNLFKLHCTKL